MSTNKLIVYGASVSYYTGKLETYLRYQGMAYERRSPYPDAKRILAAAGIIQHPMVELSDGRFMTDSTPMLLHWEADDAPRSILPGEAATEFIAHLIEDYADEWLWRPAMHYRWSYDHDRALLSRILTDELASHVRAPRSLKIRRIQKRQKGGFVDRDGVTASTWDHVEQGYRRALSAMTELLANHPYLLGPAPTIADFGLMGPMLRHFGQDPTPAEIMRTEAPAVYEWVARMWHAQPAASDASTIQTLPEAITPLLQECCETHLVQLDANARAFSEGAKRFGMSVQGTTYAQLPISRYRVWCLEQLRARFAALDEGAKAAVRELLVWPEAGILWDEREDQPSRYDVEGLAPFNKAINVYNGGVP